MKRDHNERGYYKIAAGLREFGYSDVTAEMVKACHLAWSEGKPMPHGVVGAMLASTWDEGKAKKGGVRGR